MRTRWIALAGILAAVTAGGLYARSVGAHCDAMDGPVVTAAKRALATGDVNHVLPWVAAADEDEIRAVFDLTSRVRLLSPEARQMADLYFFETVVRVHRAGEGAPYTGLKPAGAVDNPAIAAADGAFATGSADDLVALLTRAVEHEVRERFAHALAAQSEDVADVAARRRGVHAYVEFVHYVEAIAAAAEGHEAQHGDH